MSAGENTKHTPGPWVAANMVHAERGGAMTLDEIGLYVANSVRKTIDHGGSPEQFLFITGTEDGGPDICLVGNGPRGPENARLIAAAPEMRDAIKEKLASDDAMLAFILNARPSELGEEEWGRQHKNRCDRGRAATQALRAALSKAGV